MKIGTVKILAASTLMVLSFCVHAKAAKNAKDEKNSEKQKIQKVKVVDSVEDEGSFQAKNIDVRVGNVKYKIRGSSGNFQMLVYNSAEIPVSLFSSNDEYTSSFYDLKIGKRIFRLNETAGVITGARKNDLGGQMVYIIPNKARLFVKYERVKNDSGANSEIIKVSAVVMNKGKKTETFALKSVLDTVLGEKTGPHFSTATEEAIDSERQFRNMKNVKWILSSDKKVSVQFLVSGADVTEPEVISMCNKDFSALSNWIPVINSERNFDSVISYNNSALSFVWNGVELEPGASHTFCYYMALTTDSVPADGEKFISWYEKKYGHETVDNKYSVKDFEDAYQRALDKYNSGEFREAYEIVMDLWKNPENRNDRLEELKKAIENELGDSEEPEEPYDYDEDLPPGAMEDGSQEQPSQGKDPKFDLNMLSSDQLDHKYIRGLLDRINSLENEDGKIDRNEILRLNAELDVILEKLRQK